MTAGYFLLQALNLAGLALVILFLLRRPSGRWRTVWQTRAWLYQEHSRSGARRALPLIQGGYQPIDLQWLAGGDCFIPPDHGRGLPVRPLVNPVSPDHVRRG